MIKITTLLLFLAVISNAQEFTIYNQSNSGLIGNNVQAVVIDNDGNKWFGTDNGLSILKRNGTWKSFTTSDGLGSNNITDLYSYVGNGDSNFVEVATDMGVSKFHSNNGRFNLISSITKDNSELVANKVTAVAVSSNNIYWYGTLEGCSTFDGTDWNLFSEENYRLISNNITDIISPENDWIYIASGDKGVSRVKQDVDGISSASEISTAWSGIASDSVYTVFVDKLGKRWYGTTNGVSMHTGDNTKKNWTTYQTEDGLVENNVTAISQDSKGKMWFGTIAGLSGFNGTGWENYNSDNGLTQSNISDLSIDKHDDIWLATNNGVTFFKQSTLREYVVRKTDSPITIDGKLDEPQWQSASLTEYLVNPADGSDAKIKTRGKLLWDNENLYIGFIAEDPDVWGVRTMRDSKLWKEEPVEVFCDPDGDTKNYFEIEINPLGTELDILMSKAYSDGGTADFAWDIIGLSSAISVAGTLNDPSDTDTAWYCEMAIPFSALDSRIMGSMSNPPTAGDMWRLNLARYNRMRDSNGNEISKGTEISSWNNMGVASFHVPERFGKIFFSDELVTSVKSKISEVPQRFELIGNYPNPFNPSTKIVFNISEPGFVSLKIYNALGQEVATLVSKELHRGYYEYQFNAGYGLTSGIYFARLQSNGSSAVKKMLLLK